MASRKRESQAEQLSILQRVTQWIVHLPRWIRLLCVTIFALAATLSLSPLVDLIYVEYFFSFETRILPSLVSAGVGLVVYVLGWWLMIGTIGETPIARITLLWYCGVGILAVVVVVFLIVRGVTLVQLLTGV